MRISSSGEISLYIPVLTNTGHICLGNKSFVVTKTIKMWDTLKGYALTANDRKNFTVKQLQIIIIPSFRTTDAAAIH